MRIRPSTLAIVFVVALFFAGLYITDSSLRRSDESSRTADAQETAAVARSFLLVQAEALSALNGIFVDGVARRFTSVDAVIAAAGGRSGASIGPFMDAPPETALSEASSISPIGCPR